MITAIFVVLAVAAVLFTVRLVLGPTLPDRILALDGVLGCVVAGLVVETVRSGSPVVVDAVLVLSLTAFIGTGVAARFVERRGG